MVQRGKFEPIIELMDRTMNGERVFPDTTPKIKFGNAMSTDFTERELEVLRELTSGDTNTEIAKNFTLLRALSRTIYSICLKNRL